MKRAGYWLYAMMLLLQGQGAFAFEQCGALWNAYGPYDYWVDKDRIGIVEIAHMRPEDQRGKWAGGLDYTLRAIPNHPQALMALVRMAELAKVEKVPGAHYSVECYFDRALRFRPNDGMARMIYANFLAKHGRNAEAVEQLEKAQDIASDNANLQYNMGLAYFELGNYEKALTHAHRAYAMGFELPGLRNKLERVGKWREPERPSAAAQGNGETADVGVGPATSAEGTPTRPAADPIKPVP